MSTHEDIFSDLPTLETERLTLRKVTLDDAPDVYAYARDPAVSRYTTWDPHESVNDTIEFLKNTLECYENSEPSAWGIELKETGHIIGMLGFMGHRANVHTAAVGYVLSRDYWNRGLMTEALRAVIGFSFERLRVMRFEAHCLVENNASRRVMEKTGMTFEGTLRSAMYFKHRYWDVHVLSILRDEWKEDGKDI